MSEELPKAHALRLSLYLIAAFALGMVVGGAQRWSLSVPNNSEAAVATTTPTAATMPSVTPAAALVPTDATPSTVPTSDATQASSASTASSSIPAQVPTSASSQFGPQGLKTTTLSIVNTNDSQNPAFQTDGYSTNYQLLISNTGSDIDTPELLIYEFLNVDYPGGQHSSNDGRTGQLLIQLADPNTAKGTCKRKTTLNFVCGIIANNSSFQISGTLGGKWNRAKVLIVHLRGSKRILLPNTAHDYTVYAGGSGNLLVSVQCDKVMPCTANSMPLLFRAPPPYHVVFLAPHQAGKDYSSCATTADGKAMSCSGATGEYVQASTQKDKSGEWTIIIHHIVNGKDISPEGQWAIFHL